MLRPYINPIGVKFPAACRVIKSTASAVHLKQ